MIYQPGVVGHFLGQSCHDLQRGTGDLLNYWFVCHIFFGVQCNDNFCFCQKVVGMFEPFSKLGEFDMYSLRCTGFT